MPTQHVLHTQITVALKLARRARFAGDHTEIDSAEEHLNRLIDRLTETVPV